MAAVPVPVVVGGGEAAAGEEVVVPHEDAVNEHGKIMSTFGIFIIVLIIVMIGITALFATNAVFFNRIRDGSCAKISKDEAEVMYWLNVVLAVISGIVVLVAIILLLVYWRKPKFTRRYLGRVSVAPGERFAAGYAGFRGQEIPGAVPAGVVVPAPALVARRVPRV